MCSSEFTYKWDLTLNDLTKLKSLFFIFLLLLNGKCSACFLDCLNFPELRFLDCFLNCVSWILFPEFFFSVLWKFNSLSWIVSLGLFPWLCLPDCFSFVSLQIIWPMMTEISLFECKGWIATFANLSAFLISKIPNRWARSDSRESAHIHKLEAASAEQFTVLWNLGLKGFYRLQKNLKRF